MVTSPNQFGFLLDLSKAYDKMNHFGLYIKLMNKSIPVEVLSVLENWFALCLSCVKWGSIMSYFYVLKSWSETRSVLSPFLFSAFIDDLVKLVNKDNIGCRIGASCTAIFLYADDIILLAPSVQALQFLVSICISEFNYLDMAINVKNRLACVLVRDIKMSVLMLYYLEH